ncbi:hypothetical protein MLD52_06560 [Puniceicoccaceae bacterium K14]|nr:hypothetical protein [Puniceicoccaceae bacterium K14]
MTAAGWTILIISVSIVTTLFVGCIYKVLTANDEELHVHGLENETPDKD